MIARIVVLTGLACLSAGAFANGNVTAQPRAGLVRPDERLEDKWKPRTVILAAGGSTTVKFVSQTQPPTIHATCSYIMTDVGTPRQSKKGWVTVVTLQARGSFNGRCIVFGTAPKSRDKKLFVYASTP